MLQGQHLAPPASSALQSWPAAALRAQHQLVQPFLQSSLTTRGDIFISWSAPRACQGLYQSDTSDVSAGSFGHSRPAVLLSVHFSSAPPLSYKRGQGRLGSSLPELQQRKVEASSHADGGLLLAPVPRRDAKQSLTGHWQKRIAMLHY